MNENNITYFYHKGYLTETDVHFGRFMAGLSGTDSPFFLLAATLVSNAAGKGDVCLDLASWAETELFGQQNGEGRITCPKIDVWREVLRSSPVVGGPGDYRPLILDERDRLYLYRYWMYEQSLSNSIAKRIESRLPDIDPDLLKDSMNRLFPKDEGMEFDWHRLAAMACAFHNFCVITGGPGTGKTTVVTKLLALLAEQAKGEPYNILLCAPTGKAAAKLSESIKHSKNMLNCSEFIKNSIPLETYTIHRMLKPIAGSPYFFHNAENPLSADLVVVDEASMVDIALMSKLVQAVPEDARLLLLGDRDQLASVEAGHVLGDICDHRHIHRFSKVFRKKVEELTGEKLDTSAIQCQEGPGLHDAIVYLKQSYRFARSGEIEALGRAVNLGEADRALHILRETTGGQVRWEEIHTPDQLRASLETSIIEGYAPYLEASDPFVALERFQDFIILCAIHFGPFGIDAVNALSEKVLSRAGLIDPDGVWYKGRPVLITRNDYNLGLFNGDIGITLPAPGSGGSEPRVYFPSASGVPRWFMPHRLPEHRTVYAMTVHKSQGSEFEKVLIILPDRHYPVLSRELLYTGITRAKKSVSIWGTATVLNAAVSRKIDRRSGLRDALWKS